MNKEMNKLTIGCDIGGVVKCLYNDEALPGALEGLERLLKTGHKAVFISKCGQAYIQPTKDWLNKNRLDHIPIFFCESYEGKLEIAHRQKISVMIDDKIQVLKLFTNIRRIWVCAEDQKISGTKKHHPELFTCLELCRDWSEIMTALI